MSTKGKIKAILKVSNKIAINKKIEKVIDFLKLKLNKRLIDFNIDFFIKIKLYLDSLRRLFFFKISIVL